MQPRQPWRESILKGELPEDIRKTFIPESVEAQIADGVRKATFVLSTGTEDRDGDVISPDGWDLAAYRKNPVVLFAHDTKSPPIARSEVTEVKNGKLRSETVWPDPGVYAFADTIYGLVKGGFLKGTSVGFHPKKAEPRATKGIHFLQQELYEFSILPIPANREALVEAKSAGFDVVPVVEWAEEFLAYAEKSGLWVPKFSIEKALKAVMAPSIVVPGLPEEKESEPEVMKYIREEDGKFNVYSEAGKRLGTHATKAEAESQLRAIEASKHKDAGGAIKGDHEGHPYRGNATDGGKKRTEVRNAASGTKMSRVDHADGKSSYEVEHPARREEFDSELSAMVYHDNVARATTRRKESEDEVTKLADALFGSGDEMELEIKGTPPWMKDKPKDAPADAPAAAPAKDAPPADAPPAPPTDDQAAAGGGAQALLATLTQEITPLAVPGGNPVQVAPALKAALEKFAAAFMQQFAGAASAAPPDAAPPQAAPPPATPPPAKSADFLDGFLAKLSGSPEAKSAEDSIFGGLTSESLSEIVQKAVAAAAADHRMKTTGQLPD